MRAPAGSSSLYATAPMRSRILYGPAYRGPNFPGCLAGVFVLAGEEREAIPSRPPGTPSLGGEHHSGGERTLELAVGDHGRR